VRKTTYARVETPEELAKYVRGVKDGVITSLVIVERGGTGKSSLVRDILPEDAEDGAAWKSGRITPVKFYLHLYENCDRTIVLDDAPDIARNLTLAGLLRQLCETRPVRTVSWDTQNRAFEQNDVPTSFATTSRFVMITNRWMDGHEEVEALETRCKIVRYEPTVEVLHEQARCLHGIATQVADYVGAAIKEGRVHRINLRDYILATQDLRIGSDWRGFLERQFFPDCIEDLDFDEELVRAWALQSPRKDFAARDLLAGPRRFRGQKSHVDGLLKRMVADGKLVEIRPDVRKQGRGRPPASRFVLATAATKKNVAARRLSLAS